MCHITQRQMAARSWDPWSKTLSNSIHSLIYCTAIMCFSASVILKCSKPLTWFFLNAESRWKPSEHTQYKEMIWYNEMNRAYKMLAETKIYKERNSCKQNLRPCTKRVLLAPWYQIVTNGKEPAKVLLIVFYWTTQTGNPVPELVSLVQLADFPSLFFSNCLCIFICLCICICHLRLHICIFQE